MSGGSFDYLCDSQDVEDLLSRRQSLEDMADYLSKLDELEYPGASAAADRTLDLLNVLDLWEKHAQSMIRLLDGVWKAVEWSTSGDWGKDSIKDALKELTHPKE